MRNNVGNVLIAMMCAVCYVCGIRHSASWDMLGIDHLLYIFSHANFFHLLANVIVVLSFRKEIGLCAWIAAIGVSFLPLYSPILGLSALLFAHVGSTWAPSHGLVPMCRRVLPLAIVAGLLPAVCLLVHIYALFAGYFIRLLFIQLSNYFGYVQNLSRP